MITVSKSKLKAEMLEYFRRIEETGECIVVTNRGKPVIRIEPIHKRVAPNEAFRELRDRAEVYGDLIEPEDDDWKALATCPS